MRGAGTAEAGIDFRLPPSHLGVIGYFACTFFGKGKWTFFRKVK